MGTGPLSLPGRHGPTQLETTPKRQADGLQMFTQLDILPGAQVWQISGMGSIKLRAGGIKAPVKVVV